MVLERFRLKLLTVSFLAYIIVFARKKKQNPKILLYFRKTICDPGDPILYL